MATSPPEAVPLPAERADDPLPTITQAEVDAIMDALAGTKKKRRPKRFAGLVAKPPKISFTSPDGLTVNFSYDQMLDRVYEKLHANNPELATRTRKKLKPPQVMRVGTTRTAWVNFKEICDLMKRSSDHVLSFFLAELGTTGAIDGSDRLLLRGKYLPKAVESLLRKYIAEYVVCRMCRQVETTLSRDAETRLYFMNCTSCGSSRSVQAIKSGYKAVGRGERRRQRRK